MIDVLEEAQKIFKESPQDPEQSFSETIDFYKLNYQQDLKLNYFRRTILRQQYASCSEGRDSPDLHKKTASVSGGFCSGVGENRTLVQTSDFIAFYMFSFCLSFRGLAGQKLPTHPLTSIECLHRIKVLR